MVVDKPDWSQASYQEMNDLVIRQGARIAELELTLGDFKDANDFKDKYIRDLEDRYRNFLHMPLEPGDIVAHLDKENITLKNEIKGLKEYAAERSGWATELQLLRDEHLKRIEELEGERDFWESTDPMKYIAQLKGRIAELEAFAHSLCDTGDIRWANIGLLEKGKK